MSAVLTPAVTVAVILLGSEATARVALRRRTRTLVGRVLDLGEGPSEVVLPRGPVLPGLLRLRVEEIVLRCGAAALPTLRIEDVELVLRDVRLDLRATPCGGAGLLRARIDTEEIARQAGFSGRLTLGEDSATVRWMGVPLRFTPQLRSGRIRLAPTPFSLTLPPLPPGTEVTAVRAAPHGLGITAAVDLATLFSSP